MLIVGNIPQTSIISVPAVYVHVRVTEENNDEQDGFAVDGSKFAEGILI